MSSFGSDESYASHVPYVSKKFVAIDVITGANVDDPLNKIWLLSVFFSVLSVFFVSPESEDAFLSDPHPTAIDATMAAARRTDINFFFIDIFPPINKFYLY